jgi:hypothetical protein
MEESDCAAAEEAASRESSSDRGRGVVTLFKLVVDVLRFDTEERDRDPTEELVDIGRGLPPLPA